MTARGSHGTLIQVGDGGSPTETFATIAELADIQPPGITRNLHEAKSQTQTWVEHVAGMLQAGPCTAALNFIPDDPTHDEDSGIIADAVGGLAQNYRVVFPAPTSKIWGFSAFVQNFQPTAPVDGLSTADVTWQPTGAIDFDVTP